MTMELKVERFTSNKYETVGRFFLNGKHACYTLEDEHRDIKVMGETRIPSGRYEIKLRTVGGHHNRYAQKYSFHRGMLHLQNVPGFEYILIHVGNTDKDTMGCLLVGSAFTTHLGRYTVTNSVAAYKLIYPPIAEALIKGEKVWITIEDKE